MNMEKNIYLNRKYIPRDNRKRFDLSKYLSLESLNKGFGYLSLVILVLFILILHIMLYRVLFSRVTEKTKSIIDDPSQTNNTFIESLELLEDTTISSMTDIERNKTLIEKNITSSFVQSEISALIVIYFFKCFPHTKYYDINISFLLTKPKDFIPIITSYSNNEITETDEGYYCTKEKSMLISFYINNYHQSPKCIEINQITTTALKTLQVKLSSIIIYGKEVHLYELKTITIHPSSIDDYLNESHYTLFYKKSLRFCLDKNERTQYDNFSSLKGIDIHWENIPHWDFCFKYIYFIY